MKSMQIAKMKATSKARKPPRKLEEFLQMRTRKASKEVQESTQMQGGNLRGKQRNNKAIATKQASTKQECKLVTSKDFKQFTR